MRVNRLWATAPLLLLALSAGYADPVLAAGPAAGAAATSTARPAVASAGGSLGVTVDYVLIGRRLHLQHWPVASGARVSVRIDVWLAPNAGGGEVTELKGDGLELKDCSGLTLRPGQVSRIHCLLVAPRVASQTTAHIRIVVRNGPRTYRHSFVVLIH